VGYISYLRQNAIILSFPENKQHIYIKRERERERERESARNFIMRIFRPMPKGCL
jgi:hypothetical protein